MTLIAPGLSCVLTLASVPNAIATAPGQLASVAGDLVVIRPHARAESALRWMDAIPEGRPPLRGFRAPGFDPRGDPWPFDLPSLDAGDALAKAAAVLQRSLARDGLLDATIQTLDALRSAPRPEGGIEDLLRRIGIPVDWLSYFRGPEGTTDPFATWAQRELESGVRLDDLRARLTGWTFAFRPTLPGFAVATESGEHEIGLVRLQLTSGTYWTGPGDGGCLDLARQLVEALPEADFVASVEEKHLATLVDTVRPWPLARAGRLTVIPEPFPVSQWAQDNGKPGFAPAREPSLETGAREVVTLAPRYASRGEDGAAFLRGETFALEGFAALGHRVVRSPLLFQGGDLIAAVDPTTGARVLFMGEAELWRNTALGLTRQQVLDAFRAELGVDRCVVLPAVSFHIDYELVFRAIGGRLVAFVNDPAPAVEIVLACGVDALEAGLALDAESARLAREHLGAGRREEFMEILGPALQRRAVAFGHFPESITAGFSRGPNDNGVGNFQRLLLALDRATSASMPPEAQAQVDPHSAAYLRSFLRRDAERRTVIEELERLGLEVARIPSLAEGDRGIGYLNGIQTPTSYLMPAWGGLYEPLDRAAEEAFRRVFGDKVRIVQVLTSESQRRSGAVHCSASICPRP